MKKVLIIPQLKSHLLSAQILEKNIKKNNSTVSYLNTGDIYGFSFEKGVRIKNIPWINNKLFQYNGIKRNIFEAITWFYNRKNVTKLLKETDVIIIFSESSFIRNCIIHSKTYAIKTHLIMEGIRSENRVPIKVWRYLKFPEIVIQIKLRIIYKLTIIFQSTRIHPFLPGLNGSINVDYVYPIGEYSKNVIKNVIAKGVKVLPYGVPKYTYRSWPNLRLVNNTEDTGQNILYITSAFFWHGKIAFAQSQKNDLRLIARNLDRLAIGSLYVRLHPKEDAEHYQFLKNFKCFKGFKNHQNYEEMSINYNRIYANISTMIIELSLVSIIVQPILINFNRHTLIRNFTSLLDSQLIIDTEAKFVKSIFDTPESSLNLGKLIYSEISGFEKLIKNVLN